MPLPSFDILLRLGVGAAIAVIVVRALLRAFYTTRAMALVPMVSRRLSHWVRARAYTEDELLQADGADTTSVERRRAALHRLASRLQTQHAASIVWATSVRDRLSDLRFSDVTRVPFPFVRVMREQFNLCSVVTASRGPRLQTLDGEWTIDVSGSYGVNVAGFDRYKAWIEQGWEDVKDLGPVLGPLHPIVADNLARLTRVSGMDEVSFHMSGTEAVMAAVRLARFNTRRTVIVCFSGAYHGWWDGVQPGLGSERTIDDCLTLKDVHPASLAAIRHRAKDIAAVLVNPVQSFHPNAPPPNDAVLLTSGVRKTEDSTARYATWLRELREVCTACGVPLIFDEVYTGFRLAPGGAQEYFGVRADMVVYGKTVAGGLPIGVVCGTHALMRRFDPDRPMRMAYVVGTFSAHPAVMGAMNRFLRWLDEADTADLYRDANERCDAWVRETNQQLAQDALPVRVMNLATVWTVLFKEPGRYNWLLQYYFRAEGLTLSWVGTGRCLASMDFTDVDYRDLRTRIVEAVQAMKRDGWWLDAKEHPGREQRMRVGLMKELAGSFVPTPVRAFYGAVMQRKEDDHHASHNHPANQALHLLSSSVFIYCYFLMFTDLTTSTWLGLAALLVRQFGHAVIEPACHDEESLLLGYTTRDKTLIVLGYLLIPVIALAQAGAWTFDAFRSALEMIALNWFRWTAFVIFIRVVYLTWTHDFRISMIWFVKLITDPITDIIAYFPKWPARA